MSQNYKHKTRTTENDQLHLFENMRIINSYLQPLSLAGMIGIDGVSSLTGITGVDEVVGVALRNGENLISNIYFGNDFIAIAKDNIKNKNHEIKFSIFLKGEI